MSSRHPFFFPRTSCIQNLVPPDNTTHFCDTRRLYLHFLCTCCWEKKSECWEHNKLWYVDVDLNPIYADGGGTEMHPYMPCPGEVAWPDWKLFPF